MQPRAPFAATSNAWMSQDLRLRLGAQLDDAWTLLQLPSVDSTIDAANHATIASLLFTVLMDMTRLS